MKVYFKNLDGIRFCAALLVLLHHCFYFKEAYSPGFTFVNHSLKDAGRIGVNLFFVLSGFLISYLLFVEKEKTGTISFKKFYIRRALRIWPLYFLCGLLLTVVGPFVAHQMGLQTTIDTQTILVNLVYLMFFAINFQLAFNEHVEGVFQISWSVCIEEQFYLIWPLIINAFRKNLVKLFVAMLAIRMVLRVLVDILPEHYAVSDEWVTSVNYMLLFDKLDLFGGGMMVALLYFNRARYQLFLKRILHPSIQILVLIATLIYSFNILRPSERITFYADHMICVLLFGYLLLAAIAENSILKLETPLFRTLGKVSYGIYLIHTVTCQVLIFMFKRYLQHPESWLIYDVLYPSMCIVVTCVAAYFSYEYFEKRFLVKKKEFAVVSTRI